MKAEVAFERTLAMRMRFSPAQEHKNQVTVKRCKARQVVEVEGCGWRVVAVDPHS